MKNIPLCSERQYMSKMYSQVYSFIERIRWRASYFNIQKLDEKHQEEGKHHHKNTFPTRKTPPSDARLADFENALYKLISNIKFKNYSNQLLKTMKKDLKKITTSDKLFIFSDKSTNIYKIDKDSYNKLLKENITSEYKKSNPNTINKLNDETFQFIKKYNVKGKIKKIEQKQSFITIKDHKKDFPNKINCRLINPTKSPFNRLTKTKLDTINKRTIIGTKLNQWKNTDDVIKWFNSLTITPKTRFIKFDITKFYPTITKNTLIKAIKFAEKFTPISNNDQSLILHSCKSTIFYENETWEKISSTDLFNVGMGSYNGAEICDMVGLFLLNEIKTSKIFKIGEFGNLERKIV